jgi:effector-binding domain-containing protein
MSYNCNIEERPDQPVLSIRTRCAVEDLPEVLGRSYGAIAQYLGELGETPGGAPFVAYYNMDMQDLDIEIGFPVTRPLEGKGEIQEEFIPGGKMATCLHIGAYKEIEPAYNALNEFIAQNKYESTGVAYEFYLNDPNETPEEELQTQIVFPLKVV